MASDETPVTIKVTPIDNAAKGSRRQRRELMAHTRTILELTQRLGENSTAADTLAFLDAMDAAEAAMLPYLATSDGSPLADALDDLSVDDFNALSSAILGGGAAAVPKASDDS